jgi:hypothetical protein
MVNQIIARSYLAVLPIIALGVWQDFTNAFFRAVGAQTAV